MLQTIHLIREPGPRFSDKIDSTPVVPRVEPFKKIVGVGYSAGSGLLNFGAIVEDAQSPFDGLILTASLIVEPGTLPPGTTFPSARDIDPVHWRTLDPAYITDPNRTIFYPADPTAFSSRVLIFSSFTMDVASVSMFFQTPTTSLTTHYTGHVAKVLGSDDQLFCAGTGRCVKFFGQMRGALRSWWNREVDMI
ncbi:hypothetical protein B0H17DRAFT_1123494 [Mycena rosella]|uniref:Uncharacterized protein n=1 Tax=Mycena rosella TaxID=1033263 RepID=A0AAD7H2E8_MYCRO|nr:hypothetical protein B0H17DRAFT_1123494 [Mycena rosella]